jgi:hypothetical protein
MMELFNLLRDIAPRGTGGGTRPLVLRVGWGRACGGQARFLVYHVVHSILLMMFHASARSTRFRGTPT